MVIKVFNKGDKVRVHLPENFILNNKIGIIINFDKDQILPIVVHIENMKFGADNYVFGYDELERCK